MANDLILRGCGVSGSGSVPTLRTLTDLVAVFDYDSSWFNLTWSAGVDVGGDNAFAVEIQLSADGGAWQDTPYPGDIAGNEAASFVQNDLVPPPDVSDEIRFRIRRVNGAEFSAWTTITYGYMPPGRPDIVSWNMSESSPNDTVDYTINGSGNAGVRAQWSYVDDFSSGVNTFIDEATGPVNETDSIGSFSSGVLIYCRAASRYGPSGSLLTPYTTSSVIIGPPNIEVNPISVSGSPVSATEYVQLGVDNVGGPVADWLWEWSESSAEDYSSLSTDQAPEISWETLDALLAAPAIFDIRVTATNIAGSSGPVELKGAIETL